MNDRETICEFASNFFGYGNLESKVWFVGFEEGFPKHCRVSNSEQVKIRAKIWCQRREPVWDLKDFHQQVAKQLANFDAWFRLSPPPPIQPTWRGLIYLLLKLQNDKTIQREDEKLRKERIREFQRNDWGSKHGRVALLEMYGLPNPTTNHWNYDWFTRDEASEKFRPIRHAWFQKQLKKYEPELVVFYKNDSLSVCHWSKVCEVGEWKFGEINFADKKRKFRYAKKGKTTFVCIPHPTRTAYKYFDALVKQLQNLMNAN